MMNKFEKAESIIMSVIVRIGGMFPDSTVEFVGDLIDHNEYGVALKALCTQAFEYGIDLSIKEKCDLKEAARLLEMPLSNFDILSYM